MFVRFRKPPRKRLDTAADSLDGDDWPAACRASAPPAASSIETRNAIQVRDMIQLPVAGADCCFLRSPVNLGRHSGVTTSPLSTGPSNGALQPSPVRTRTFSK